MADNRIPNYQQIPSKNNNVAATTATQHFQHQFQHHHHHSHHHNQHSQQSQSNFQNYQNHHHFQYQTTQLIPTSNFNLQPGTTVIPAKVIPNPNNPQQQILTYTDSNGVEQQVILNKSLTSGQIIQGTSVQAQQQPPTRTVA